MSEFKTIANVDDVIPGSVKRVDVAGTDVLLANVEGAYYAVADRCGHMNASLSAGSLTDRTVRCKMHGAVFDVTTGEVVSPPPDKATEQMNGYLEQMGIPQIETCKLDRFEARVNGDDVQIKI